MKVLSLLLCALFVVNGDGKHADNLKLKHSKAKNNSNKRIVGGELTSITQYPYQVAIEQEIIRGIFYKFMCGGSIISNQHILTAGHCLFPNLRVKFGTSSIVDPFARTAFVDQVFKHPNYTAEGTVAYNDIAVLKLRSKITFGLRAEKVALPDADATPTNSKAVVTGWGLVLSYLPVPSLWLMKADLPVISNEDCAKSWANLGFGANIRDTNVCTLDATRTKTACNGDSGGPLVQDGKVIGVVSWGPNRCEMRGAPAVYTKVSRFVSWIKEQLAK